MSLSLQLADIEIDPSLIERIPPKLAAYYQALPLGYEEGVLSVAMAHPENATALTVLRELVGLPIVPVRVGVDEIRLAFKRFYSEATLPDPRVLAWSALQEKNVLVNRTAEIFAAALAATVISMSAEQLELETVMTIAREGQFNLTVIGPPEGQAVAPLLQQSGSPLVLVGDAEEQLRRILVVLRGYSSDEYTLNWLAPLLRGHETTVTLLPLLPLVATASQEHFSEGALRKEHLEGCLHHASLRTSRAWLKFRQGEALNQVLEEIGEGTYDWVIIAAEGYGEFVGDILKSLDRRRIGRKPTLIILKPPVSASIPEFN